VSGLHTNDTLLFRLQIDLEKLLHDVVAILEVGVLQLKFQLDENVVVLILVCCRAKLLYFFLLGRLALLLRFGLCAQNLHLSQHVKVTIRAQPRRVLTIVLRLFALA